MKYLQLALVAGTEMPYRGLGRYVLLERKDCRPCHQEVVEEMQEPVERNRNLFGLELIHDGGSRFVQLLSWLLCSLCSLQLDRGRM